MLLWILLYVKRSLLSLKFSCNMLIVDLFLSVSEKPALFLTPLCCYPVLTGSDQMSCVKLKINRPTAETSIYKNSTKQ